MSESQPKRFSVRFSPDIGAGQLMQALVVAAGICWAVLTYAARVDTTQHDLALLRTDVSTQMADLRAEMARQFATMQSASNDQFRGVRTDIANLPDVRASLAQLEKRVDQADARASVQSGRIDNVERLTIRNDAELQGRLKRP